MSAFKEEIAAKMVSELTACCGQCVVIATNPEHTN